MGKYHIKEDGSPGVCTAEVRECPVGSAEEHYATPDEARHAYEASMASNTFVKTKVVHKESYTVRVTSASGMQASYGNYATAEDAWVAAQNISPNAEVVKVNYTSKTVNTTQEEVVNRRGESVDVAQKYEALHLRKNNYNDTLMHHVRELDKEYTSLENKRGWIESKLAEAGEAQNAFTRAKYGSRDREQAKAELDEARIRLLAADVVHIMNTDFDEKENYAATMIGNEKERADAEEKLREAYGGYHDGVAGRLRIQPEDVSSVYAHALKQVTPLRGFTEGGIAGVEKNAYSIASKLRIQPEDVVSILNRAKNY